MTEHYPADLVQRFPKCQNDKQRPSIGGGRTSVPENLMSTLTLSGYNSTPKSSFTIIRYTPCTVATLQLGTFPIRELHSYCRLLAECAQGLLLRRNNLLSLPHHHDIFTTYYVHKEIFSEPQNLITMVISHYQLRAWYRTQLYSGSLPSSIPPQSRCWFWLVQNDSVHPTY